jgi:hypothetical protein
MTARKLDSEENLTESEIIFKRLEGLVVYLAGLNENPDHAMLSKDDIISELHEEIQKGINYYTGKYKVDDMVGLIKRMCYNRISELKYRYYITYRKQEKNILSIEMEVTLELEPPTDEGNPEYLSDSSTRVRNTLEMLESNEAKLIFQKIINDKDFHIASAGGVHNHMTVEDIAAAVGLNVPAAAVGIREIKRAYAAVCEDDI